MPNLTTNSPQRDRRILAADAAYTAFLAPGFPLDDYPGETLQIRNEMDRTNWLGLVKKIEWALRDEVLFYEDLGLPVPDVLGDYPIPEPGLRCTSNAFIRPKVKDVLTIMEGLLTFAEAAQANWWRLKDECRSVTTRADLEAIDMGAGWP
jgi:hypothetical protein